MEKIKEVLKEQISLLKPTEEETKKIKQETAEFIGRLEKQIRKKKIKAEVFIGGSLAKSTLVKKDKYDIDIFVRFDKKYKDEEISKLLGRIVSGIKEKSKKIHGSRDYFQISKKGVLFEVIPVTKIKNPNENRNITDLSYFHVNYIKSKIKKKKNLGEEIILTKSFCHFQDCYGAEGYIRGFSGYALELLISEFGSLLKFLKAIVKADRMIFDPKKFYKNKDEVMLELNESKLQSPIVFVDPTFKERNALAALSRETYEKFRKQSKKFLKNPSNNFFKKSEVNERLYNLIVEVKTKKQKGDIAGSKLKKFYEFLIHKLNSDFNIQRKEFQYDEDKNVGRFYFNVKTKGKIIISGPPITSVEHVTRFRKKHKNKQCFVKNGVTYCKRNSEKNPKKFISRLKVKEKRILKEMKISGMEIKN